MYKILAKEQIAPNIHQLVVSAPLVAAKAQAGNFVILRTQEWGERIPITIANHDPQAGTITLVIQAIGKSTKAIANLKTGDVLLDVLGPLGTPAEIQAVASVIAICGGIGVVPTLPLLRAYRAKGANIVTIMGARSKDLFVLVDEVKAVSDEVIFVTDDGSHGMKGLVTDALMEVLEAGRRFDQAIAIGPAPMMKATCLVTKDYELPTLVSLNAIMVDGTGMCGACRVTIGGETKFTCVDGPDFDGHLVDFDELMMRQAFYREEAVKNPERQAHGEDCECLPS